MTRDGPKIMGILNATPDSFSDGGQFLHPEDAARQARLLVATGAMWLDIGAESTRPGAPVIDEQQEWQRLEPVLRAVAACTPNVPRSVDTRRPAIAAQALALGARAINDVSADTQPEMLRLARISQSFLCLMHGFPAHASTGEDEAVPKGAVEAVFSSLQQRAEAALSAGLTRQQIWLDPGLGFGKSASLSLALLGRLEELVQWGFPVLVGPSRKRFLSLGCPQPMTPEQRDQQTAVACALAAARGARLLRVHNPQAVVSALQLGHRCYTKTWRG